MRNSQPSNAPPAATGASYSPSVPISLYRQVATELQSSQTLLETLRTQNQQLVEQNQQLRLEIERIVQSALQLRQVADVKPLDRSAAEASNLEVRFERAIAAHPEPSANSTKPTSHLPNSHLPDLTTPKQVTEQDTQPRRSSSAERTQEIGGWWLVLVIVLIVVTAFGTGFLIVRPLLPNR